MSLRRVLLPAMAAAATLAVPGVAEARRGPSLGAVLERMHASGRLSDAEYRHDAAVYRRVRSALRRLGGAERAALGGALDNARALARQRRLDGRVVPVFLILERNYEWFWERRRGTPAAGARELFGGSQVVFQFYSGQGWQVQPLASFGRLNALLTGRRVDVALARALADDLLALAVTRGGHLANEYYFPFSGGGPGWVSGMAQATGLQALARLWKATGDARYLDATRPMLELLDAAPPTGVRVSRYGDGPHFLLYSQSPRLLVGNGFAQALVGLFDYAQITGEGRELLAAGLARARSTIGRFDTGAWSRYYRLAGTSRGRESNLHYHRLFTTFLGRLCDRTGEAVFCRLEQRFEAYESRPVRIGRLRERAGRDRLVVRVWTSKRGSGTLTLWDGDRVIRSARFGTDRGTHVIRWGRPERGGRYRLTARATSLNGIESRREEEIDLPSR